MKSKYCIITQHILLCLIVCLVYSPAFRAEPCLLDDVAMLRGLQGTAQLDLSTLLIPNSTHFAYYRPLIGFSYWLAQTFWHANPQDMHMENVIFHMLNVVLIFWLIRLSIPDDERFSRYIPFLGALLFAVHPITTESVNWISGRTDLIAGTCLIGATITVVAWQRQRDRWWLLPICLLLATGGIMTKEVAWGFLFMFPFFLAAPHDSRTYTLTGFFGKLSRLEKLLIVAVIALCFFLSAVLLSFWPAIGLSIGLGLVVLYRKQRVQPLSRKTWTMVLGLLIGASVLIYLFVNLARQNAAEDFYSTFSRTILLITLNVDNSIALFSAALAFYIKKFFLPLPLNFAITDIASGYLFAGIVAIILTAFLAAWRSRAAILFLAGIALLLPALPLVHGEIAWAPYAERYIYIPSGFWIASLAVGLSSLKRLALRTSCAVLCLLLIPMAALITYKRSVVWQTNSALFGDTVQKSPNHLKARILNMTVLAQAGRLPEALEQYRRIHADPGNGMRVKYSNDLAQLLYQGGLKREAWEVLDTTLAAPLPGGRKHPLAGDEWQRLYGLHAKLRQELFPKYVPGAGLKN
jgi:hypothetical protein